jgi:hypothetical protein
MAEALMRKSKMTAPAVGANAADSLSARLRAGKRPSQHRHPPKLSETQEPSCRLCDGDALRR